MNKKLFLIISLAVIVVAILLVCFIVFKDFALVNLKSSEKSITNIYQRDKSSYQTTVNCLKSYSSDLSIDLKQKTKEGYVLTVLTPDEMVKDEVVKDKKLNTSLEHLNKNDRVEYISKDTNGIYFTMHSGIQYEQGMVYSMDAKKPTPKQEIITRISLINPNWYYYEGK